MYPCETRLILLAGVCKSYPVIEVASSEYYCLPEHVFSRIITQLTLFSALHRSILNIPFPLGTNDFMFVFVPKILAISLISEDTNSGTLVLAFSTSGLLLEEETLAIGYWWTKAFKKLSAIHPRPARPLHRYLLAIFSPSLTKTYYFQLRKGTLTKSPVMIIQSQ